MVPSAPEGRLLSAVVYCIATAVRWRAAGSGKGAARERQRSGKGAAGERQGSGKGSGKGGGKGSGKGSGKGAAKARQRRLVTSVCSAGGAVAFNAGDYGRYSYTPYRDYGQAIEYSGVEGQGRG